METRYEIPRLPLPYDLETKEVLRQLNKANKKLAELKGIARTIPNENILLNTLTLQEAKESSAVENIVTTQDDLYKAGLDMRHNVMNASVKEVLNYREAIQRGFILIKKDRLLTINTIKEIQKVLERNSAGFRNVPGTSLKRSDGEIVYVPPQDIGSINRDMANLERFINDEDLCGYDPLIKMAIIHHQFESIHPFFDGNGRTGRIINVLYLVLSDLLDLPVLYLSLYITQNKGAYYHLMQAVRDAGNENAEQWEDWILFMLKAVEETAESAMQTVKAISAMMARYKNLLRPLFGKQYRHELLNNLFYHPYTKVEFLEKDMQVQRLTATRYLNKMADAGILQKVKIWRTNYYINTELMNLFVSGTDQGK